MNPDVWGTCDACGHLYNASQDTGEHHAEDCVIREYRGVTA